MRLIVLPVVTIAALVAGCGSTSPVTEPLSSLPAVEPAPSTVMRDTAAVEVSAAPTSSVASDPEQFAIVELQSMTLEALPLCERVISVSFFVDESYSYDWHENGRLVVEGDDYVDSTDGLCVNGVIDAIEDDPHGNYPTIELAEADGVVTARELIDDGAHPLEVTGVDLRDAELAVSSFGPELDAARNVALTHIKALLEADAITFEATMNDEMMWFDDNALTTPGEVMGFATEEAFPWGEDHSEISIEDYLKDYEPTVTWLGDTQISAETRQVLTGIAGTSDVVIYGAEDRHGRPKVRLGTDLGRYALAMTDAGWRVIAI